ncbi:MAG: spore coat protein [Spirochaetaceae bacterium]|nr:spore coat protein [Spirochaetaceae bacterium]
MGYVSPYYLSMTALILQARLDSSRLPRKALLPLGEKPLIHCVMETLKQLDVPLRILACPEDDRVAFKDLAASCNFELFCGSKYDVLGRFCSAIRHFALEEYRIIRATGDNPFVFTDAAEEINNEAAALNAAYSGYAGLPYGAGIESVTAAALLQAEKITAEPYHREHVCPYLYENGAIFTLHRPLAPLKWQRPAIRLSVDTIDDYARAVLLYAELHDTPVKECSRGERVIGAYDRIFC